MNNIFDEKNNDDRIKQPKIKSIVSNIAAPKSFVSCKEVAADTKVLLYKVSFHHLTSLIQPDFPMRTLLSTG